MGARASDSDLSGRLFSALLPWGRVSGGQGRREDESVSPGRAGDSGRQLVQKWQAGLNTVFFFFFFLFGIIIPKGQVPWWAKVSRTHGSGGLAVVRNGGVWGPQSPPGLSAYESVARPGTSEQQGWGRPGRHSLCFWCVPGFEMISLQCLCPLLGSLRPGAKDCDT